MSTGGCSAVPWDSDSCDGDACSLEDCDLQSPDNADSCEGVACPSERCDTTQHLCGVDQPYQCLEGSARFGCSDDQFGWAAVTDTLCASCCDTRSCEETSLEKMIGGDKDAGGCLVGAGYTWCEPLGECVRTWETPCPGT